MKKNILIIVAVVIVVVVAWFVYKSVTGPEPLASELAATLDISELSLEGEVFAVGGNYVMIRAGRVQKTDQGNVLATYDIKVLFADEIRYESLAKLKAGDTAVFYGTGTDNPPGKEEFTANRVEVLD